MMMVRGQVVQNAKTLGNPLVSIPRNVKDFQSLNPCRWSWTRDAIMHMSASLANIYCHLALLLRATHSLSLTTKLPLFFRVSPFGEWHTSTHPKTNAENDALGKTGSPFGKTTA